MRRKYKIIGLARKVEIKNTIESHGITDLLTFILNWFRLTQEFW